MVRRIFILPIYVNQLHKTYKTKKSKISITTKYEFITETEYLENSKVNFQKCLETS